MIEGACRHLVKDRCERSGMRWTINGAESLLHLRCAFAPTPVGRPCDWDAFHASRHHGRQQHSLSHSLAICGVTP